MGSRSGASDLLRRRFIHSVACPHPTNLPVFQHDSGRGPFTMIWELE